MNGYQSVMEPHGGFIGRKRAVVNPVANVAEQDDESFPNFTEWNSDIPLGLSILPGPFPGLVKHFQMQLSNVFVGDHVQRAGAISQGPRSGLQNVLPLPLVEFLLGGKTRNQVRKFIG